jgi:hypothetical protein
MATGRLQIIRSVITAYGDVGRILRAMPKVIIFALLLVFAIKVLEDVVPASVWEAPVVGELAGLVVSAAQDFCLTPVLIAIHRFIILNEVTPGYDPNPGAPGFLPFFGWLFALSVMSAFVFSVPELSSAIGLSAAAALVPTFVVLIAALIVSMRLTILFPAIAVGARGASASNALADSKGHAISIALIFLLALLPFVALALGITFLLGPGVRNPTTVAGHIVVVTGAVIHLMIVTFGGAIASRVFRALAHRVTQTA